MDKNNSNKQQVNVNIDPLKTPVYYADGYVISSNQHVVTFNFMQDTPNPSQKHVVSRVALTRAQAKELLRNLNDHIEKFEV